MYTHTKMSHSSQTYTVTEAAGRGVKQGWKVAKLSISILKTMETDAERGTNGPT